MHANAFENERSSFIFQEVTMTVNTTTKEMLVAELEQRVADGILQHTNANLLKKLIISADDDSEAMMIAQLGTMYKKTGFHFDQRLEDKTDSIRYFKKSEPLSFRKDDNKPTNKLVIGDNYESLQNLLIQYRGKVDIIYIDPPYGKDSMGEFAKTNYENAITRDNLLSMLYPRLLLAKQLLTEDGVIYCSIDDKNQAYIKCLFDEIFGEKNYSGMLIWQKKQKPSYLSQNFVSIFEYILCYTKNSSESYPFSLENTTEGKKWPINNAGNPQSIITFPAGRVSFNLPDGIVKAQNMSEGNIVTHLLNDVKIKDGKNQNEFSLDGEWRYSQEKMNEIFASNDVIYIAKIPFRPNHIRGGGDVKKMKNFLANKELSKHGYNCETNEDGSETISSIFDTTCFSNPKPVGLVELLIKATTYNKPNATVLDFFSGSGTTGHAVLNLNKQDGGNRTFILCQLNENLDKALESSDDKSVVEKQIALCNKYNRPHELSEITAERLRRIMTGKCFDGSTDFNWLSQNEPYNGNLDVYEIAEIASASAVEKKSPFDVIDETLYGKSKFTNLQEKIEWICSNFYNAQYIFNKSKLKEV